MTVDDHPAVEPQPGDPVREVRPGLLRAAVAVSVLRLVLPVAVIPFAAALIPQDLPLLLLLRPGKEVVLLGGGLSRATGAPTLGLLFLAYLPLMTVGVWSFFVLGRAWGPDLRAGTGPGWLQRHLPEDKMILASRVLTRRGAAIAILGRLAALPAYVIAAAAGASDLDTRRYLLADLAGTIASFALTVSIGYALGDAYERGGPWLTAAGVALFVALVTIISRWIQREAAR